MALGFFFRVVFLEELRMTGFSGMVISLLFGGFELEVGLFFVFKYWVLGCF